MRYNWHIINCTFLKCTIWWILASVYTPETITKTKQQAFQNPSSVLLALGNYYFSFQPHPQVTTICSLSLLTYLYFVAFYINGIKEHVFLVRLSLLSLMLYKFPHVFYASMFLFIAKLEAWRTKLVPGAQMSQPQFHLDSCPEGCLDGCSAIWSN